MLAVNEIMTPNVVTIGPDASIGDAIELLLARRVSGLPVVDGAGRLVGILTEFALMALAYDQNVADHTVADHMTHDVLTVDADDAVNKVADLCIVHRVRRLPVLEKGRLVGLVSRRDVLEALYKAKAPVGAC
ncbi:MAG: CBS domain-containing protein [Planctomycetota bacterium]